MKVIEWSFGLDLVEGSSGLKGNSVIWLPQKGDSRGEDAVKELNAKKWDDAEV